MVVNMIGHRSVLYLMITAKRRHDNLLDKFSYKKARTLKEEFNFCFTDDGGGFRKILSHLTCPSCYLPTCKLNKKKERKRAREGWIVR